MLDVGDLFKKEIINYFIDSYLQGLTPNPCAYCNRLIKFGLFFEKIRSFGIDYLATGHYAKLIKKGNNCFIKKNKDTKKTQEYFLALVKPDVLKNIVFPLANYTKIKVKRIARDKKIIFKHRGESQDVCFVKDNNYKEIIEENRPDYYKYSGDIVHLNGKVLGKHRGIYNYTYGQRTGLGISWPKPLYVAGIDSKTNNVIVAESESVGRDEFKVESINWHISPQKFKNIKVKTRYNSSSWDCSVEIKGDKAVVKLKENKDAIAPGQVAAFYYKDLLLGGGIIVL